EETIHAAIAQRMQDERLQRVGCEADDVGALNRAPSELSRRERGSSHHIALLLSHLQRVLYVGHGTRTGMAVPFQIVERYANCCRACLGGDDCLCRAIDKRLTEA